MLNIDYEKGGNQIDFYDANDVVEVVCPLCRKDGYVVLYQERGALRIVRCNICTLIYVNPRLKEPEKIYWGDADKYFEEAKLIFEGKKSHHRDKNYLEDLNLISKYKSSGNFLDVGTNIGFFLNNAKKYGGWSVYGVEPSPSLSDIARNKFGLNIKTAFLEDANFDKEYFDVITMTDVFEHIAVPGKILSEIMRILKPNGILFIKVPNGLFNIFKFKVARWSGKLNDYDIFDSYEHVVHYSEKTLNKMLEKHGFSVVETKIGSPIQTPVWHNYVGHYYQYPTPWCLDWKRQTGRIFLYLLSKIEFYLLGRRVGCLAPNIVVVAQKL